MEFKDYYATLGVEASATQEVIKKAYRKLARKYHPDVSKEADAEARFKAIAEAHEALIDVERRAAYDDIARRHAEGAAFEPQPGWDSGFEYSGPGGPPGAARRPTGRAESAGRYSEFFESLFGQRVDGRPGGFAAQAGFDAREAMARRRSRAPVPGRDHHAKVAIELRDSYAGAERMISLHLPVVDAAGRVSMRERQLEIHIPKGIREGQRLRLAGQGAAGAAGAPAGDLYLEIQWLPHPVFQVDGTDLRFDLPVAPWEAILGATVSAPTLDGSVQLSVPPGSMPGRQLRLKGKGLPGLKPGDLYAVLTIALPPAASALEQAAYGSFASAFPSFNPREALAG